MGAMKSGFTIIELLVVVTIIGILAAIGLPTYLNAVAKAEESEVLLLLDSLAVPIEEYRLENNKYPGDVVSNTNPGLSQWPEQVPFDSIIDYESWGVAGGECVVLVNHFGRNHRRDSPTHVKAGPVGSIVRSGDDLIKTVAIYDCDNAIGPVR